MENPSRWLRLAAFSVDFAIILVLFALRYPGFPEALRVAAALGVLAVLGYQAYLLSAQGQTIGKRAFKLRIVRADDGTNGGFWRNVALRHLVGRWLLGLIPFYMLCDALFVFRADTRCVHDFIAGTRVVKAEEAAAS